MNVKNVRKFSVDYFWACGAAYDYESDCGYGSFWFETNKEPMIDVIKSMEDSIKKAHPLYNSVYITRVNELYSMHHFQEEYDFEDLNVKKAKVIIPAKTLGEFKAVSVIAKKLGYVLAEDIPVALNCCEFSYKRFNKNTGVVLCDGKFMTTDMRNNPFGLKEITAKDYVRMFDFFIANCVISLNSIYSLADE